MLRMGDPEEPLRNTLYEQQTRSQRSLTRTRLFFYRLLSGSIIVEAEPGESWTHKLRRRRRRTEIARDI